MITSSLQNSAALAGISPSAAAEVTGRQAVSPRPAAQASEPAETGFDLKSVQEAATKVEKFVSKAGSDLSFSVDQETGINIVTVLDRSTNEVIRQIPSREIIQIAQALDKVQGLLLRNQA